MHKDFKIRKIEFESMSESMCLKILIIRMRIILAQLSIIGI